MLHLVVIANPGNRRVSELQQALAQANLPPATVLAYAEVLTQTVNLEALIEPNTWLRLESPEKDFAVERALIARGAGIDPAGKHQQISAAAALTLPFDRGQILYPRQWYLGWRDWLHQWAAASPIACLNDPREIALMFDKPRCQALLRDRGLPVPAILDPIACYDDLREQMRRRADRGEVGGQRVFVKLAHGSAASGVVAYRVHPRGESAITTVELVRQAGQIRLYNSRKICHYTEPGAIAAIINLLAAEGVQVEAWLPKARLQNHPFDLRVVVIGGQAQHVVVRLGKSPMTNLHLGNERGDLNRFLARIKPEAWQAMQRTCEAAAALFPHSLYCGIDLLVAPDFQHHAILEINAFGDLLPGITWQGMDTYTSEIQALSQRLSGTALAVTGAVLPCST